MKVSIFNALNIATNEEFITQVVSTGDYKALILWMKTTHIAAYTDRIFNDATGLQDIMTKLDASNSDIKFISIINNTVAVGFMGGLTVEFIINYNRNSVEIKYNLPIYC